MKESGDEEDFFSPKLCTYKDDNNSPHGKFHRFLFPISSKLSDLNISIFTHVMLRDRHSEPGLPVVQLAYPAYQS